MSVLLTNIGLLATQDPELGELTDAAIVLSDDRTAWVGPAARAPAADEQADLDGRAVLPGFVDSHAHLVFAGDRAAEFAARMAGTRYVAGGIQTTVAATRAASDDVLRANLARLARELLVAGVTTFECKSGYGLDVSQEQRSLRLASEFTPETTFLGAHVVPPEVAREDYLASVCGPMLAACAPHARWVDAFCEDGAFSVDECRLVLQAGLAAGLGARLHANQLGPGPGVGLAVELGAASADHCTYLTSADVDDLATGSTVATLLPLVEFSTRSPYPDARTLLDAGAAVAIATDCNPGSGYSTSMPLAIALAVREMRMTPREAVYAATMGGAAALRRDDIGRIAVGQRADLTVLEAPSYIHLAYRPGVPLIAQVWRSGVRVV
jgi:imidazolonepropionase